MKKGTMFGGFDMSDIERHKAQYAEEVRRKYDRKTVEESERRTSGYTKGDWSAIMAEWEQIFQRMASLMEKGPAAPEVQEAVGELRQQINDKFYTCTPEIFRGLGDLYVSDERFTHNIDQYKTGLAAFLREAMHAYCDSLEE